MLAQIIHWDEKWARPEHHHHTSAIYIWFYFWPQSLNQNIPGVILDQARINLGLLQLGQNKYIIISG